VSSEKLAGRCGLIWVLNVEVEEPPPEVKLDIFSPMNGNLFRSNPGESLSLSLSLSLSFADDSRWNEREGNGGGEASLDERR
jgi:hypothetical protein